ncbi:MAG: hypothetical protein RBT59_11480 [Arcobacteraceae bacterium]|jgi:hypothetical protein|nr:hypothetical protein [Arcobacteraceae bacterium]
MSIDTKNGSCESCGINGKLNRRGTNHLLHLFIIVVLGMLDYGVGVFIWVVVWISSSIKFGGWTCSSCGSRRVSTRNDFWGL